MAKKSIPAEPVRTEYTVLARRYRPRQFGDLVGQDAVAQALVNALKTNRVAHAYLFTGARGVGKTSTARIVAKALNCVHGPTATPCDACEICQSIAAGEDVDVLEIDGASNRGIDEVREIRQNVQYRPARARYKVYIVDEVHMLTAPAFNALLKTLEEPPPHVKFILATTEVQKIPVTILSRCQRFDFAGIGTERIVERLGQVVAAEGMQADTEALELVARRAGGSMRDAQSLLDQLLAFGGERLTADHVHRVLGTAHDDRVLALAAAVVDRDVKRALEILHESASEGLQLGELADQLIDYWRDLMVAHCAGPAARDLSVSPRHRDALLRQAAAMKLDTILAGLDVLATTKSRLRSSGQARVLLEMAVVRLSRLDDLVALSDVAQWLQQAPAATLQLSSPSSSAPARPQSLSAAVPPEGLKKKIAPATPEADLGPAGSQTNSRSWTEMWPDVLGQLGHFLANSLGKAGMPAISGPNTLVLSFPAGYNSEREHCQLAHNIARVEKVLSNLTGQAWHVRIETGGGPAEAPASVPSVENVPSRSQRLRNEAFKDPLVRRVVEVLGAQVVTMDEGFGTPSTPSQERDKAPHDEE